MRSQKTRANQFRLDFSYHRTDYPDWKDHRVILPAPRFFITTLNEEQKLSKDPLPMGALQDVTYDVKMKFPESSKPVVPENVARRQRSSILDGELFVGE